MIGVRDGLRRTHRDADRRPARVKDNENRVGLRLGDSGLAAAASDAGFAKGINTHRGRIT